MATKAKKLLITTVSHEVFIVRVNLQTDLRGYCPNCGSEVELLTFDTAVSYSGLGGSELIKRLAAEESHAIESASGHLLICKRSLARAKEEAG